MCKLITISRETEQEYIDLFCSEYKNSITTPDGFVIVCKHPEETARHICGGKTKKFQEPRARYILWPKYIFQKTDERIVLRDNSSKNIIFFFEKKRIAYAVICSPLKSGELNLISGFITGGKRVVDYRKGNPPYSFYKKAKSC